VPAPVQRVMWLDDSLMAPGTREALLRAFDDAALYGEETRVARRSPTAPHAAPRSQAVPQLVPVTHAPRTFSSPRRRKVVTSLRVPAANRYVRH
jgi:hypothetical protein